MPEFEGHEVKDDRIIYLAVRHRGEGAYVEGGFNGEFDWLDEGTREAVITLAFEALMANMVAMLPDRTELKSAFDETMLGKEGGPNWRGTPPTPFGKEELAHGNDDQAAGDDRAGESASVDPGDRAG